MNIDFLRGEFIGKEIRIKGSGVYGKVIDETRNGFLVSQGKKRKRLPKQNRIFELKTKHGTETIDGSHDQIRDTCCR